MRGIGHRSCTQMGQCLTQMTSRLAYFTDMCSFGCASLTSFFPTHSFFPQSLRTIYTGKSSAFTGHRSASKRSQAEIHEMREVFPEAVAYAAVQVCLDFKQFNFCLFFDRLIMACRLSSNGVCTTATSGWIFSFENASSSSLQIPAKSGLRKLSVS